ncbi:LuxR C-terminal-related transcriptional regulator [Amycolatopsis sp. Poz14]|uniref:helix-turn-helix transcriptional regulator n=1 Tax=Amycolatopsis sp. Poz14 TaxID=1447705 RepID=UPI0027E0185E|nr:LuxR C-terminal-related transcriptional regulator [Amycolatopsis sp. Poz14]
MSAAARPGRVLPVRKPADVALVLLVTADAVQVVSGRLKTVTAAEALPPGPNDNVPRYRVSRATLAPADKQPPGTLTSREVEVLQRIALGLENAQIAAELFLSVETVRTHVKHILKKLGAINRAHAVHEGYQRGVFDSLQFAIADSHTPRDREP